MRTLALNDDLILPVAQSIAWRVLHDLALLQDSLPVTDTLTTTDAARAFHLSMDGFEGRLTLLDLEPPNRLRLSIGGTGPRTGSVQGQAQIRLEKLGDQRTLVHVALVLQTERQPPSFKLQGAARLKTRLAALAEAVERRHPSGIVRPVPQPPKPWPQRLLDWYLGWFAGIFDGTLYPPPAPRRKRPPAPPPPT